MQMHWDRRGCDTAFNTHLALQNASREVHWKDSRQQMQPSLKTARARTEVKKKVIANIGFKEWKKTSCISLFFLYTPVYVQAQQLAEAFVSTGRGKKASGSTSHWDTRTLWCTKLAEKTSLEIAGKEAVFCSVSLLSTETRLWIVERGEENKTPTKKKPTQGVSKEIHDSLIASIYSHLCFVVYLPDPLTYKCRNRRGCVFGLFINSWRNGTEQPEVIMVHSYCYP